MERKVDKGGLEVMIGRNPCEAMRCLSKRDRTPNPLRGTPAAHIGAPHRAAAIALLLTMAVSVCGSESARSNLTNGVVASVASTQLHPLFRVSPHLFSGPSPDSGAAFAEIARLGVKTILSVDGGPPNVALARAHGMRCIHLPIGYDGVPPARVAELVKAALSVDAPIYVFCHHGRHRGPAVVAILGQATAGWTTNQAVRWLQEAGTSTDYPGLYRSVIDFRMPDAAALERAGELPEASKASPVVEAMVAIESAFEQLRAAQQSAWTNHERTGLSPVHTATVLWEHLRELHRINDTAQRSGDYRTRLAAAEQRAYEFRELLREPLVNTATRVHSFRLLSATCGDCHQRHRN